MECDPGKSIIQMNLRVGKTCVVFDIHRRCYFADEVWQRFNLRRVV
jgi:hypothetical protein